MTVLAPPSDPLRTPIASIAGKAEELMKKEGRTRSELLKEALRRYFEEQEGKEIVRYGRTRAKEKGIREGQVEDIVDAG